MSDSGFYFISAVDRANYVVATTSVVRRRNHLNFSTDQIDLLRDYSRLLQTRSQTELILSLTAAFAK